MSVPGKRFWVLLCASPAQGVTSVWRLPTHWQMTANFACPSCCSPGAAWAVVATVGAQAGSRAALRLAPLWISPRAVSAEG